MAETVTGDQLRKAFAELEESKIQAAVAKKLAALKTKINK